MNKEGEKRRFNRRKIRKGNFSKFTMRERRKRNHITKKNSMRFFTGRADNTSNCNFKRAIENRKRTRIVSMKMPKVRRAVRARDGGKI